jgi:hypothetical protein
VETEHLHRLERTQRIVQTLADAVVGQELCREISFSAKSRRPQREKGMWL